jgi:RNA polymerase sigma-70 factor (ECF subfamily)
MTAATDEDRDRADMERLQAGQDAALNDLMARHSERLFHFLVRALQNETEAADLAEETFVRIYQSRVRFDPRQKFSTWLYAIAANLARDRFRWRARHPEIALETAPQEQEWPGELRDPQLTPGETVEKAERARIVREAVGALPEEMRTPLILAEFEGLSHAEIGQVLGCSPKAVEMRLYRARQQLRTRLADCVSAS